MSDLSGLLKDHQIYPSKFEQDNFITVKTGITCWGQYKQSLRELYLRVNNLKEKLFDQDELSLDIEGSELTIQEIKQYITKEEDSINKKRLENELAKNELERARFLSKSSENSKVIEEIKRELTRYTRQALFLKETLGEITSERRDTLDREFWEYKVKTMVALDLKAHKGLTRVTMELIYSMPSESRKKLLQEISATKNITLASGEEQQVPEILFWYDNEREDFEIIEEKLPNVTIDEALIRSLEILPQV